MIRRKIIVLAAATAVVTALAAAPAFAGKGGNGNGGGGGSSTTQAWVSASPNATTTGQAVHLSGCGYEFKPVQVEIVHSAGYTQYYTVGMWSNGCLDNAYFTAAEAGTYTIRVWQANSKPLDLMASTSLSVA